MRPLKKRVLWILLLVLVVAVFANVYLYYRRVSGMYLDEVRALGTLRAEQIRKSYDARFQTLLDAGLDMAYDSDLVSGFVEDFNPDYYHKTGLMRRLETLLSEHREIKSAYIYLADRKIIVSTETGRFHPQREFYHHEPIDVLAGLDHAVSISDQYTIDLFGDSRNYVSLSLKVPPQKDLLDAVLVLNFDMSVIYESLVSEFSVKDGWNLRVADSNGSVLFDAGALDRKPVVEVTSKSSGFRRDFILSLVTSEFAEGRREHLARIVAESLLIFAAAGLVLALFILRVLKPVTDLIRRARADADDESDDGVETLSRYVDRLTHDISELKDQYVQTLPVMKERFASDLIRGLTSSEEVEDRRVELGLSWNADAFVALCVHVKVSELSAREIEMLKIVIISTCNGVMESSADVAGGIAFSASRFEVAVLLGLRTADFGKAARRFSDTVVTRLPNQMRDDIFVSIGSIIRGFHAFNESYSSAVSTLDYMKSTESQVLSAADVEGYPDPELEYPYEDEQDLMASLRAGDVEGCEVCLDRILSGVTARKLDRWETDFWFMQLFDRLNRYVFENRLSRGNGFKIFHSTYDIVNSEDTEALKKLCIQYIRKIIEEKDRQDTGRDALIDQVRTFVESHYSDKNLQLLDLEDDLKMNRYYVSHQFKRLSGESFSDFVHDVRIRKAESLLETTLDTIRSIADQVGYTYTYYFIRQFKKRHGITPKDYRNRNLITRS